VISELVELIMEQKGLLRWQRTRRCHRNL